VGVVGGVKYGCRGGGWGGGEDGMVEAWPWRNAARLVTVSPIWAEQLRRRHNKPTEVVYNGYAAEDFPPPPERAGPGKVLTIRYLGSIYQRFRDPSPLFSAIALLPQLLRQRVLVELYADDCETLVDAQSAAVCSDA